LQPHSHRRGNSNEDRNEASDSEFAESQCNQNKGKGRAAPPTWIPIRISADALPLAKGETARRRVPQNPGRAADVAAADRQNDFEVGVYTAPLFTGNYPPAVLRAPGFRGPPTARRGAPRDRPFRSMD